MLKAPPLTVHCTLDFDGLCDWYWDMHTAPSLRRLLLEEEPWIHIGFCCYHSPDHDKWEERMFPAQ